MYTLYMHAFNRLFKLLAYRLINIRESKTNTITELEAYFATLCRTLLLLSCARPLCFSPSSWLLFVWLTCLVVSFELKWRAAVAMQQSKALAVVMRKALIQSKLTERVWYICTLINSKFIWDSQQQKIVVKNMKKKVEKHKRKMLKHLATHTLSYCRS